MSQRTIQGDGFSLRVPGDWCDITATLETDSPFTLALPDGVGALQFSSARYVSGVVPQPTPKDLDKLLIEFATAQDLGPPRDRTCEDGPLVLAAATFSQPDAVFRIWYVSDRRNFAKVSYTCGVEAPNDELQDCETIVRSITWT